MIVPSAAQFQAHMRHVAPSGRLRGATPGDLGNVVLATMPAEFAIKHPAIALDIDLSARFVDLIDENFDSNPVIMTLPNGTTIERRNP